MPSLLVVIVVFCAPSTSHLGAHKVLPSGVTSLNDMTASGTYNINCNNLTETPKSGLGWSMLVVQSRNQTHGDITQTLYSLNTGEIYARALNENSSSVVTVLSDWRRLDNFGCNTPADLASLLGGILHFKFLLKKILTVGVAETFTGYGMYFIDAGYWGCEIIHVRNDAYSEILNELSVSLQISVSGNVVSITADSPYQVTITMISW